VAAAGLPLSTLLSGVLVAFTIELDNEFERLTPHRTTITRGAADSRSGPWLVSLVMWSNLMQFVTEEGVSVGELQRLARTGSLSLAGMERWGYITVEPGPSAPRSKAPRPDWVVRPTRKGLRAQRMWRPLLGVIEERWRGRFGTPEISRLREALSALISQFDVELPEYLPVLGYGLLAEAYNSEGRGQGRATAAVDSGVVSSLPLTALLSQALLAFTIDFERESEVSMAISANVMRLLGEKGVPVRDLPRLSGVSKEAIAMALSFLEKRRFIVVEPTPNASRGKVARLTHKGQEAQDTYRRLLGALEERWRGRFGEETIHNVRESLEQLVGEPSAHLSPLFRGLEPHPDGWRASVPRRDTLPHYPMVLHRGGYPDGS
jgi:DNA-binding MarR family transcriptional regulator